MKIARILLVVFLLAAAARAGGPAAETRAFVEIRIPRNRCYVREPFRVVLRVGFDRDFFDSQVVALFGREMDFQARVRAAGLEEIEGAEPAGAPRAAAGFPEVRAPAPAADGLSFALNDDVVLAKRVEDRDVDGVDFVVLEVERKWRPVRPGEIVVPAPELRFAYATEFRGHFISGRRPVDRHEAIVRGKPATILVLPLPEEGKPASFTGAVGRFTVQAQSDRAEVAVGESLKVTLVIDGEGDLSYFDAPRLDDLPGFHVYGAIDDRTERPRRITYDLAPTDATVDRIPPLLFPYFDPAPPGRYQQVETAPIPLTVRPGSGRPAPPEPAPTEARGNSVLPLALTVTALAAIGLVGVILRRRARKPPPLDPAEVRARAAADEVCSGPAEAGEDLSDALSAYLALRLGCHPAAVIGPDLESRLAGHGVPAEAARRAARLMEDLVGAKYGGDPDGSTAWKDAAALVRDLEDHFRATS